MLIVAVDIGGTFTDLLGYDTATGQLMSSKSPSTPAGLEQGIHDCLKKAGVRVNGIDGFVHGSTIAINTVLERRGVRTALIVTKGTRDVYKIGRGNRPDAYDIWFKRAEPLVPRHLTFEVEERLFATGEVHTPLNVVQAETIAGQVNASGAESVAVCFLHSWNNPIHEQQMAQLLNSKTYRSVSHEILREYGEYERISTTVLNSYIGPKVNVYLAELERMLGEQGFRGNLSVMQSNGGLMSSPVARHLPVAMLESGPVGGFIAAARTGAALGYTNVIGFDMGGTTAKANLARDGEPQMSHGYHIGGYASGQPMMLPVVDTVEVGSGGGSIAKVDQTGSLKVGPVSAGADPGPACYGKGGTDPTVTDANLLLGRLDPNHFLGGEMALNIEAAREAVNRCIARPLGLSETEVARSLHIPLLVIPNFPGQFSASGMLLAEPRHDFVRTYYRPLDQTDFSELGGMAADMESQARKRIGAADIRMRHFLEVRYTGQDFSLPISVDPKCYAQDYRATVGNAFHELHHTRFGYHDPDLALEVVNAHLTALAPSKLCALPPPSRREEPALMERRPVIFDSHAIDCPVYRRESLAPGEQIDGPAIIQEYASTTVLFPDDRAEVTVSGELLIRCSSGVSCSGAL